MKMDNHKFRNLKQHERTDCGMRYSIYGAYEYRGVVIRKIGQENWEMLQDGFVIGGMEKTRQACKHYIDEQFDFVHGTISLTEDELVILKKVLKRICF